MLALISFLLVTIGSINWFCIGILQFDFVAGIFGSQSNIFSRLIYTLVGIASIVMVVNFAKNKGKFIVSFKKAGKEYEEYKEEKKVANKKKALSAEAGEDFSIDQEMSDYTENSDVENSADFEKSANDEYDNQDNSNKHKSSNGSKNHNSANPHCDCDEHNNCGCDGHENCECGADSDGVKPTDKTFSADNFKGNSRKN